MFAGGYQVPIAVNIHLPGPGVGTRATDCVLYCKKTITTNAQIKRIVGGGQAALGEEPINRLHLNADAHRVIAGRRDRVGIDVTERHPRTFVPSCRGVGDVVAKYVERLRCCIETADSLLEIEGHANSPGKRWFGVSAGQSSQRISRMAVVATWSPLPSTNFGPLLVKLTLVTRPAVKVSAPMSPEPTLARTR